MANAVDFEGQGQWPPFSISAKNIPTMHVLGPIWWCLPKSMTSYRAGKPNLLEFLVKMAKMTFKSIQWPQFSILAESTSWFMFGANLVIPAQLWDELSYRQGKVYGQTDGRTARQTHPTIISIRPERPRARGKNERVYVNHPPTCSKRVSNASTDHRVSTVWVTFSGRFHSMCERVPTFNVYPSRVSRFSTVLNECGALVQCVSGVRLTCFPPIMTSRGQCQNMDPIFLQCVENNITDTNC